MRGRERDGTMRRQNEGQDKYWMLGDEINVRNGKILKGRGRDGMQGEEAVSKLDKENSKRGGNENGRQAKGW